MRAPTTRPRVAPPLRILVAIAAPTGWPALDLAREEAAIRLAWGSQISDQAALTFAETLYAQLATGMPIDEAVSLGRESLFLAEANRQEWGTPVLFMRISDGRLFDFS